MLFCPLGINTTQSTATEQPPLATIATAFTMTWNTESGLKSKKEADHAHSRKRYSIISRRPSTKHRVPTTSTSTSKYGGPSIQKKKSLRVEVRYSDHHKETSGSVGAACEGPDTGPSASDLSSSGQQSLQQSSVPLSLLSGESLGTGSDDTSKCKYPSQASGVERGDDIGPEIRIVEDSYRSHLRPRITILRDSSSYDQSWGEDLGPEISVLEDRHKQGGYGGREEVRRSQGVDLGPEISVIRDFHASDKGQDLLQGAPKFQHSKHSRERCEDSRERCGGSSEEEEEVEKELRVVKTRILRRSMSRRNRNKYSIRRQKSVLSHPPAPRNPSVRPPSPQGGEPGSSEEGKEEGEAYDSRVGDTISLKDIAINFEPEADTTFPSSSHSEAASVTEEHPKPESPAEDKPSGWRSNHHHPIRKSRGKIRVRVCRRPRKILVLGDMTSGKTNLISAYGRDRFTDTYTPTILNCLQTDASISGELIELVIVEISGRDDFEPLRRRAYHKMDAAVVCYSVDSVQSLERVSEYWIPELKKHAPKSPFVLVGTKRDLRDDARDRLEERLALISSSRDEGDGGMTERLRAEASFTERFVSEERGRRVAGRVGAQAHLECSSLYRDGTREVFECVTRVALKKSRRLRADRRHMDAMCSIM